MQKPPGVSTLTGGRRIPIGARIVPRSGKVVHRSLYRGRIGGVFFPGKVGFGEVIPERFMAWGIGSGNFVRAGIF